MKISEKWRNDTGAILKRSWRKFEKIPSKTAKNHLKMILRWFKESSAKFWLKIPRCRSRTSSKKSRNPEIPLCRPSLGRILNNYWNQNTTNIYIYIYSSIYLYMPVILIKSSRIDVRNTNQVPTSASNLWKMAPVPSRRIGLRFNSSLQSSFLFYSLLPLASTEAVQVNWISRYIWPFMIPPVPLRRKIIPSLRTLLFDSLILWFFDSLILEFGSASAAQKLDWNLLSFQCRSPAIQKAGPSSREGRKEPSKEELEHNGRSSPVFGTASDPIIMHKHTHARTHAIRWWADGWATDAFRNSGNPSHWKSFRSMASKRKREERKGEGIKANWDEMTQEDGWMFFYRPSGPQLRVQNGREECF